jgi:hypothetical protein
MVNLFDQLRKTVYPRAGWARGDGKPPRVTSIILGMMSLTLMVGLSESTHLLVHGDLIDRGPFTRNTHWSLL